jgi:hypothetical protein
MLPIGQHGITKFSQTQFFHLYGHLGVAAVLASQVAGIFYIIQIGMVLWYKTAKFTAKKFYYHCLLGERNWLYE